MHELTIMAVKAAALRKLASEFDVNSGIGIRPKDYGLGVPPQIPKDLAPLTAADHAALASQDAAAASRPTGKPAAPPRPTGSMLFRMLKSRGGMAGLGLTAIGGAGYGLFGGSTPKAPPEAPAPAPLTEPTPAATKPTNPRMQARNSVAGRAGKAIGSWWDRMSERYNLGSRGQR